MRIIVLLSSFIISLLGCKKTHTKEYEDYLFTGKVSSSCSSIQTAEKNCKVIITAVKMGSSWSYESLDVGEVITDTLGMFSSAIKRVSYHVDYYFIEFRSSKTKTIKLPYDSIQNLKSKEVSVNACFD